MARTDVTTQQVVLTGLEPVVTEPTIEGDVVDCGRVALYVVNGSASSVTVTVQSTATVDGLNVEDLVVAVPAGATKLVGPLPERTFGQPSGSADAGRAYVDYSAVVGVDRAMIGW